MFNEALQNVLCEMLPLSGLNLASTLTTDVRKQEERNNPATFEVVEWITTESREGNILRRETRTCSPRKGDTGLEVEHILQEVEQQVVSLVTRIIPDCRHLVLHWLLTGEEGVALCLFRAQRSATEPGPFTRAERTLLDAVAPHLSQILRLNTIFTARSSGYEFFAHRTIEITKQFGLTVTEYRILRKLVTGVDNASIAREMGIGIATVKTHITHILQKTGCRNRNGLLGHYFSSIEPMDI